MSYELEGIKINIKTDASEAIKAYKELAKALTALKKVSNTDFGLKRLADDTNAFASSIRHNLRTIERYANALDKIARAKRGGAVGRAIRAAQAPKNGIAESKDGATVVNSREVEGSAEALKEVNKELDRTNKKLKDSNKQSKGFLKNLKDIVKYRLVRSALSAIGKGMKEGSDNFYGFLSMTSSPEAKGMKKSLDDISSTMLALKNTFGVTLLSTLLALKPALDTLSEGIITFAEGLNALMAKAKGSTTFFAANREAIQKWSETVKNATQGFDELNVLAGSQDTMPSDMFVKKDVGEAIESFKKEAEVIAGVVAGYEGLKAIVKLITGLFDNKNKSLKKQSELSSADAKESTALSGALTGVATALVGSAGLIGAFDLLNKKQGELSFAKVDSSVTAMGSTMAATASTWVTSLNDMLARTSSFVTEVNALLGKVGVGAGVSVGSSVGVGSVAGSGLSAFSSIINADASAIASKMSSKVALANKSGSTVAVPQSTSIPAYNQGVSKVGSSSGYQLISDFSVVKNMNTNWATKALDAFNDLVAGSFVGSAASEVLKGLSHAFGYANGGFVTSDIFLAREDGKPEMVGRIGNRTAVANNDQITEAIASAVYDAMTAAGGGGVNVTLEGDAKKLFRVVQSEARNYTRSTGSYAF